MLGGGEGRHRAGNHINRGGGDAEVLRGLPFFLQHIGDAVQEAGRSGRVGLHRVEFLLRGFLRHLDLRFPDNLLGGGFVLQGGDVLLHLRVNECLLLVQDGLSLVLEGVLLPHLGEHLVQRLLPNLRQVVALQKFFLQVLLDGRADLLPRFAGFRPGYDGIRDGLPGLEVLLEGEPVSHFIGERPRRLAESLHALLLENLDGGDDALERGDNVLQDGVPDTHHALDNLLEDAGRTQELRRPADKVAEDFDNLLEKAGEEVHHGFHCVHNLLHPGHRRLVFL